MPKSHPILELDGRTGEGGGQVVRIAAALAAVTSQAIRITNVRGGRPRGGGLKAQHVSSLAWLASATGASVTGLAVGSPTVKFRPTRGPTSLAQRHHLIETGSPASSTTLVLQAVLPFLVFAAGEPLELEIRGGTNVSFSPSWEYVDQVMLPTLEEWFGVRVERRLLHRGWSAGPSGRPGRVWFRVHPLGVGQKLRLRGGDRDCGEDGFEIDRIDASIIAPAALLVPLREDLIKDLDGLFPGINVRFVVTEDSGHEARIYVLLVAHSTSPDGTGRHLRWGRDWLYDRNRKKKTPQMISREVSQKVSHSLHGEVVRGQCGVVDEYLQDQLVVFQALAEGRTSFPRPCAETETEVSTAAVKGLDDENTEGNVSPLGEVMDRLGSQELKPKEMKKERATHAPFGEGSTHTTTARWVAAEMLPQVTWYDGGWVCDGAGVALE